MRCFSRLEQLILGSTAWGSKGSAACRPLEPAYAERWVTTEVGKRGGLDCPGLWPHIAIEFEEYLADQRGWLDTHESWATTDHLKQICVPGSQISVPIDELQSIQQQQQQQLSQKLSQGPQAISVQA